MAGFTIHLAVGEQYIEKHTGKIKDEKEFIRGIVAPDLNEKMTDIEKNKSKSHYGKWEEYSSITNIEQFLNDKNVNINEDYWKGYFLHLLTDYYFYNIDFLKESNEIAKAKDHFYHDYDCLNKYLIEKYDVSKYDIWTIRKYINVISDNPKYLEINKVIKFIGKISDFDIETEVKIIKEKGMGELK